MSCKARQKILILVSVQNSVNVIIIYTVLSLSGSSPSFDHLDKNASLQKDRLMLEGDKARGQILYDGGSLITLISYFIDRTMHFKFIGVFSMSSFVATSKLVYNEGYIQQLTNF